MAWSKTTRIQVMLAIDVMFFLLELSVGLAVGSLALLADSFHMVRRIRRDTLGLTEPFRYGLCIKQDSVTNTISYVAKRYHFSTCRIVGPFFDQAGDNRSVLLWCKSCDPV